MIIWKNILSLQLLFLSVEGWITQKPYQKNVFSANCIECFSTKSVTLSAKMEHQEEFDVYGNDSSSRRDFFKNTGFASAAILAGGIVTSDILLPAQSASAAETTIDKKELGKIYKVIPHSLDGKTVVITGGTTGLGLESAKRLAAGGATIVLTSRTPEKGKKAVQSVQDYLSLLPDNNNYKNVYSATLDLDDLKSVESFPENLRKSVPNIKKIDVLMNNAGVMAIPNLEKTKDGYERTFQSNHLGHFVLTAKLYSMLSPDARIINVSSEGYNFASVDKKQGLDLNNLNGEQDYNGWKAYGLSKLANIMFTQELQRRLDEKQSSMTVVALHPGAVNTDLIRNFVGEEKFMTSKEKGPQNFFEKAVNGAVTATLKTVEEGASTQIFLADSVGARTETIKKGQFYVDYKPEKLPAWARDESIAKALWEKSEKLSGVTFKL